MVQSQVFWNILIAFNISTIIIILVNNTFLLVEQQQGSEIDISPSTMEIIPTNGSNHTQQHANQSEEIPRFKLAILILSALGPKYTERRNASRFTYLSYDWNNTDYTYFFLIGHEDDPGLQAEKEQYGDIIFYPGVDQYSLLSSKVYWGFHTSLVEYQFDWMLKTDDDSFVHIDHIFDYIHNINSSIPEDSERFNKSVIPPVLAGFVKKCRLPHFNKEEQADMADNMAERGFKIPSKYTSGAGYLLSRTALEIMVKLHTEPPPTQVI